MNKIRILLIDDKPVFAYRSEMAFDHIPVVSDDSYGKMPELQTLFEVQWLQSPEDTKEFRDYCLEYEQANGPEGLGETGVVPHIILFDYALSGESSKKILNEALEKMPNVKLGRILNNLSYRENKDKVLKAPEITEKNADMPLDQFQDLEYIGHDNMGCFSGGLIYSLFRNHPCAAVPITRKYFSQLKGTHTAYFEWLIKDELYDATEIKGISAKWSQILLVATENLTKNIEVQMRNKSITPFLTDLADLASGAFRTDSSKRKLRYATIYGTQSLPVDGLFIFEQKNKRDDAIEIWADRLFKEIFADSTYNPVNQEIDLARKYANDLWNAYQSTKFLDRLEFSTLYAISLAEEAAKKEQPAKKRTKSEELLTKSFPGHMLNTQQRKKLAEYLLLTGNKYFEFRRIKGTDRNKPALSIKNSIELSCLIEKKLSAFSAADRRVITWTILFIILRLYAFRMDYLKRQDNGYFPEPSKREILTILFPISSAPIVLPVHMGSPSDMDKFINACAPFTISSLAEGDGIEMDEQTRYLLRSYALTFGLDDPRYYPAWLKKDKQWNEAEQE